MLTKLDNTTVTLHNGQSLTLQQHTKNCSDFLIEKLEKFNDLYSKTLKEVLEKNLGKKWSEVRGALDKMNEKINPRDYYMEYDISMEIMLCEIIYPEID